MVKRRGHGEGSIYRRSDGRWCAALNLGKGTDGRRRRRIVYGKTRAEVRRKLTELHADLHHGVPVERSKLTVAEFLGHWLRDAVRPRVKTTTFENYGRLVALHIEPELGGVRLADLGPMDLHRLNGSLERRGLGARTREAVHALLNNALSDAVRMGLISANPADRVDRPRAPWKAIRVLGHAEVRRILNLTRGDPVLEPLVALLVGAGLRVGECLALRWCDVNLDEGTVTVRHTLVEENGKPPRLTDPKTAASRRRIDLPDGALLVLRRHRGHVGGGADPGALVFTNGSGGPHRRSNLLRRKWHPLLERAGVPRCGFHALRHYHATMLLGAGANPRAVAARLGHSRPSLVLDVYGHVLAGADRDLADRVDRVLGKGHGLLESSDDVVKEGYTTATRVEKTRGDWVLEATPRLTVWGSP